VREVTERFIEETAARDWCAVVDDDGSWSARHILAEAAQLATMIKAAGIAHPTVLVQSENSRRLTVAAVAVGMVDGTLALASTHLGVADVMATVEAIRPDAIVADATQLAKWGMNTTRPLGRALDGWLVIESDGNRAAERWAGGVVIGMTSGSTGRSKGVVHSESSLRYAVSNEIHAAGLKPGDAIGVIVPVSAAPAFAFGIYLSLHLRSAALLSAKWDPGRTLDRLVDGDARWLMCVPTQVLQLAAAADGREGVLAGMKAITVGGGPMEVSTLQEAENRLGVRVLRVFGMSECLGHTTPSLDDAAEIRLGRDGRPFPGTEVRNVDDAGREVPIGEIGRGQVKGPSLFLGYAEHGALTRPTLTADGFFETGDLIARHADGTINVAGRIKDVIIRGGRNISVAEVESALLADPRIADVCAVAVPDKLLGERVAALVVTSEANLTLATVCEQLDRTGVAKIKWPEYLIAVDSLPQTHVGKLSRTRAREMAQEMIGAGQ
jgi:non-ribosomal peptide synthetase component E (peptide arylation enzyme)